MRTFRINRQVQMKLAHNQSTYPVVTLQNEIDTLLNVPNGITQVGRVV